jgi:hypothetical protein
MITTKFPMYSAYLGAVNKLYSNQNFNKAENQKLYDILNSFTSVKKSISGEAIKPWEVFLKTS